MSEEKKIEEESTEDKPYTTDESKKSAEGTSISSKESETVAEENIQHSTPNIQHNNENMEVHHPHDITHKKKWGEYLLEFFMLFLAVTMGFFVENQREHYIEKQRARQYAVSLIEDLKADTAELNRSVSGTKKSVSEVDTLLAELNKPTALQNDTLLQHLTAKLPRFNFYDPQLGTYNQIKNSGSLRYFNIEIIKRLNKYETYANYILKMSNQSLEVRTTALIPFVYKIQNTRFLRSLQKEIEYKGPVFIEKPDNKLIQEWYNFAYGVKRDYALIVRRMELQLKNAKELIVLLEKKYHLENE